MLIRGASILNVFDTCFDKFEKSNLMKISEKAFIYENILIHIL